MKSIIKNVLGSLLLSFFLLSCQDKGIDSHEASEIDLSNVFNNSLVIVSSDQSVERLNKANINSHLKAANSLSKDETVDFQNFEINEGFDPQTTEKYYYLSATSLVDSVKISVAHRIDLDDDGNLVLSMLGCSCKTTDCSSNWGCNADTTNGCNCTPCSGDCEKTSTADMT